MTNKPAQLATEHSRQSFLGPGSDALIEACRVGIVGLSGGGSHVAMQLAHVGFADFHLFDPARIAATDLRRVVGACAQDVEQEELKVHIARRAIQAVRPSAVVAAVPELWQDAAERLRSCDLLFGCVDGFDQRKQLEAAARRARIPYIDVGLDVHAGICGPPRMAGQIIVSLPGHPCMWCMGFLTEEKLAREAARYGVAGPRAQVVWANGVLASTAVGAAVQLLTGWTAETPHPYLSYDANLGTLRPHPRFDYTPSTCTHFPADAVGSPKFAAL